MMMATCAAFLKTVIFPLHRPCVAPSWSCQSSSTHRQINVAVFPGGASEHHGGPQASHHSSLAPTTFSRGTALAHFLLVCQEAVQCARLPNSMTDRFKFRSGQHTTSSSSPGNA
jgi:hypothetical protein